MGARNTFKTKTVIVRLRAYLGRPVQGKRRKAQRAALGTTSGAWLQEVQNSIASILPSCSAKGHDNEARLG